MKLSELLARVPICASYSCCKGDPVIQAITEDSRKVKPGTLFVAVRGEQVDGHDYIAAACKAGATVIVAERSVDGAANATVLIVEDSARWLAIAAAAWHGLDTLQVLGELPIIAVTGTNGKTTTTYILQAMFAAAGRPTAVIGTVTYDLVGRTMPAPWTTPPPLALAEMLVEAHGHGARAAAIEASSHALQQRRVDGLTYDCAIFTNLTGDHLDYHGTMDAYLAAKKRLFDMLPRDATAVVNIDDPAAERMVADCRARIIRYTVCGTGVSLSGTGVSPVALSGIGVPPVALGGTGIPPVALGGTGVSPVIDRRDAGPTVLRGDIREMTATGSRITVTFDNQSHELSTPLLGRHNVQNLLGAIGAGLGLGLTLEQACNGAGSLARVRGRLETVDADQNFAVVVDYAHTDDALQNVLTALRPLTTGRLTCLFGCGGDRDRSKRPRMARAAASLADRVIVTSDNPRTEQPDAIINEIRNGFAPADLPRCAFISDRAAAIQAAIAQALPGDTILVAGKGHEDYQILGTQRIHFDDVEVAREAVERLRIADRGLRIGDSGSRDYKAAAG